MQTFYNYNAVSPQVNFSATSEAVHEGLINQITAIYH